MEINGMKMHKFEIDHMNEIAQYYGYENNEELISLMEAKTIYIDYFDRLPKEEKSIKENLEMKSWDKIVINHFFNREDRSFLQMSNPLGITIEIGGYGDIEPTFLYESFKIPVSYEKKYRENSFFNIISTFIDAESRGFYKPYQLKNAPDYVAIYYPMITNPFFRKIDIGFHVCKFGDTKKTRKMLLKQHNIGAA